MEKINEVHIDYREHHRIQAGMYHYHHYNPVETKLDYGDFLFKGTDGTEVLFEYKTGHDFLNSISNNHLHNQTLEASTHYKYQFIIVQCFNLEDLIRSYYHETGVNITSEQVYGAISSLNTFSTVIIVQTETSAFDIMERQATKILEDKPLTWKFNKKTVNPALNYLSTVKGIGKQAENICRQLKINNLKDLLDLTKEDLTQVRGVGVKTAETIIKAIHGN